MLSNNEIVSLFRIYAELLLLHGANERLSRLLSGAAYRIRKIPDEIMNLKPGELVKYFQSPIVTLINTLRNNGTIESLDELIQLTPAGIFEMMRIRGLGGKKLSVLWKRAGIDTVDALLEACKKDKLKAIPGFGAKTQANIIAAIEAYRTNQQRFHYASVADTAATLVKHLQRLFKADLFSLCGDVRREATTVSGIDIVSTLEPKKLREKMIRKFLSIHSTDGGQSKGNTLDEIPVNIFHTSRNKFNYELFLRTGNDNHVKKVQSNLNNKTVYATENDIYKNAGLSFIPPSMREDVAEWNYAKKPFTLLSLENIKGIVHNHTDWSDGVDGLEDFVTACKSRGFEYVVISDHSKNAHYAGGLNEEKAIAQMAAIDELNKKLAPFRIFKSIECDILVSGGLDYDNRFLRNFDLVIISVHQLLKMDIKKATARLIKAIENPYTTILGHMSGRQLLIRPGYPLDFKKVIDACAANKVVIEINANPYRLDMDWTHIPYCIKKRVMISINPDAHSVAEIDNIRWGVSAARKGGLTPEMTWNTMPVTKIQQWLNSRKRKRGL